jgi:phosphopantetheinyl transferase (holo-ACP synthase)
MKAHRHRRLTWHDIWIRSMDLKDGVSQPPEVLIISEDGSWEDAQIVPMSISHDSDYATAVCMASTGGSDAGFRTAGESAADPGTGS